MRKSLPLLICLISFAFAHSKSQEIQKLLDSAKSEFKLQDSDTIRDFKTATLLFEKVIKLDPTNAEALYFLGYTIDRMNSFGGSQMNRNKKELAMLASEQFETVNKLQPIYKGEYYRLDPYTKIGSIWGSLAMAYQVKSQNDSAKWAFSEGKKRGGFNDALLEYNRQLLASCKPNAILITLGDNNSIPIWYLQQIENLRKDITPIDANLINISWYVQYLKSVKNLRISLSDLEINTIDYLAWNDTELTIKNQKDSQQVFSWTLKPTYYNSYILKGDRVLLNILCENIFERPIYFPVFSDSTFNLFLDEYLIGDGLVTRLSLKKFDWNDTDTDFTENLKLYHLKPSTVSEIIKSQNTIQLLNAYRWTYYNNAHYLYEKGKNAEAKKLLEEMDKKFRPKMLPYSNEEFENAIIKLKEKLK